MGASAPAAPATTISASMWLIDSPIQKIEASLKKLQNLLRFFKVLDTIFELSIQGQGCKKLEFGVQGFSTFNLENP